MRKFDLSASRSATLSVNGAHVVVIQGAAGFLRVEGSGSDADKVTVIGLAHAAAESVLDSIRMNVHRSGDTIFVVAIVPSGNGPIGQAALLDLSVRLPSTMSLIVTDPSGETIIRNVGPLNVDHGSGGLDIDGVAGPLDIRDGPGDMVVANVHGDVRIVDGTGAIYLSNVHGSVSIPTDGAGEIQVSSVTGDVTVGAKESGEVSAGDIGGNLSVRANGSGSVEYRDVKGRITIPKGKRY